MEGRGHRLCRRATACSRRCWLPKGWRGRRQAFEGRAGLFENVTGPFELEPFAPAGGPLADDREWRSNTGRSKRAASRWSGRRSSCASRSRRPISRRSSSWPTSSPNSRSAASRQKWDPQTRETADHSLPYIFARALVDGPITLRSFTEEAVLDPALRPIMAKVKVTVDDAMEAMLPRMGCGSRATTVDGREHPVEIVDPLGQPANPMQDKDIEEKFSTLAVPYLGAERCRSRARRALARASGGPGWCTLWDAGNADARAHGSSSGMTLPERARVDQTTRKSVLFRLRSGRRMANWIAPRGPLPSES